MAAQGSFDPRRVRADFPALAQWINGRPLAYLDNAATTQMPEAVIDAVARLGRQGRGNVHRGVHALSARSTVAYEGARATVQRFVNAAEAREVIFVRGATEAINLVAHSFGRARVGAGDDVVISEMEHHSNIVPWQMLCEERQAELRVAPITDEGALRVADVEARIGPRTRLVAVTHVANAIGTVNPVAAIVEAAHRRGVPVLIDGAQAAAHLPVDVRALGCDFYVLSGHKVYGPTGIGVLYGRAALLDPLPPFMGGGEMVRSVAFERTTYAALPQRFEAGTPNVEGAVGLAAAIDYLAAIDRRAALRHEQELLALATDRVAAVPGVRIVGCAAERIGVLSFVMRGAHAHDVATVLDQYGVAIRAGHHCAEPLMRRLGVAATARASFALYNTRDDIDALVAGLAAAAELFG
jgi:cysteine desulfurase/selenocysteine lyase